MLCPQIDNIHKFINHHLFVVLFEAVEVDDGAARNYNMQHMNSLNSSFLVSKSSI